METEGTLQTPSFGGRRLGAQYLVALEGSVTVGEKTEEWDAELLVEGAARLGQVAGDLAGRDPLPERDEVLRALRDVELPEGFPTLSDARLVRLAAAAAEGVSVSAQLALYPRGMPAARALKESRAVLLNRRGLTEEVIRERVRSRYPEAEPLPQRPALDDLLALLGLRWDAEGRAFVLPTRGGPLSTLTTLRQTALETTLPDEAELEARHFGERLELLATEGGFLALSVDLPRLDRGIQALTEALQATHLDVDSLVVKRLRALIESTPGGNWGKVLEADTPANERGRAKLLQAIRKVLAPIEEEILATEGAVVLTGLGLIARYDQMGLVERLRDAVTIRAGGTPLRSVVVLAPSPGGSGRPTIDGHSIPVITSNQWARLAGAWLRQHEQGEAA